MLLCYISLLTCSSTLYFILASFPAPLQLQELHLPSSVGTRISDTSGEEIHKHVPYKCMPQYTGGHVERRGDFVHQVQNNECVLGSGQAQKGGTKFLLQQRHMDIVQSHSSCHC